MSAYIYEVLLKRKKYSAGIKQKTPTSCDVRVSYKKVAATYSPTWWGSTIGDGELNFSVRNGKRWILTAITATVCFWEKTSRSTRLWSKLFACCFPFSLAVPLNPTSCSRYKRWSNHRTTNRGRCRAISTGQLWHYCLYTSCLSTW